MNKLWLDLAWDEYLYWQQTDKNIVKKINELIKDMERNGLDCAKASSRAAKICR